MLVGDVAAMPLTVYAASAPRGGGDGDAGPKPLTASWPWSAPVAVDATCRR